MTKITNKIRSIKHLTVNKSSLLLLLSFGTVLLITLTVLALVLKQVNISQTQINEIVNSNNKKSQLVFEMQQIARERSLALYTMVNTKDVFEYEETFTLYRQYAENFIKARTKFIGMSLSQEERNLINKQGKLSKFAVTIQDSIIEFLEQEKFSKATDTLVKKAIPAQDNVLNELSQLAEMQNKNNNNIANQLQAGLYKSKIKIITLSLLIFISTFFIVIYVIKRIKKTEKQLFFEKELAQITLQSIGDGVITVNKHYLIQTVNPAAEDLLNVKDENIIGKNILRFYAREDVINSSTMNSRLEADLTKRSLFDFTLTKKDGSVFEIEHTVAPIIDQEKNILGAVIVLRDVTEMRTMEKRLTYQASHDSLTNLINRREFEIRLYQNIHTAQSEKQTHSVCFLDLDKFKIINDTSGHAAGDEFLKQISKIIQGQLRSADVLARLGGDEFGVILNSCSITKAKTICTEIIQSIQDTRFSWGNNSFESGASIGIVPINELTTSLSDVMSSVDAACYEAKDKGRNRIQVFEPNDVEFVKHRIQTSWIQKIKDAIKNDCFELYFQEILAINPSYTTPRSIEILVRLRDEGEIVSPDSFIPAAERYNMMPLIDEWVISHTFDFLNKHQEKSDNDIRVAINLSGQSLSEDSILNLITDLLRKNKQLKKENICFEITETAAIANLSRATDFILQIKQMGCKFSLDDFGSGLSSFSYLKNMPVDNLKIDGVFIKDINSDPINKAFVESIHNIGKMMGIKTTAEYVENEEILNCIKSIGVDYAQGYHIAKPEPIKNLLE